MAMAGRYYSYVFTLFSFFLIANLYCNLDGESSRGSGRVQRAPTSPTIDQIHPIAGRSPQPELERPPRQNVSF